MNKNIVTIGGGKGISAVLSSLRPYHYNLSSVVSMCDDGGSTGHLRDDYGVLPPGSVRPSMVALSSPETRLRKLFEYRFENGAFKGHNFGNLFITTLEKTTNDFSQAVKIASEILHIDGKVIPVTLEDIHLLAELENGEIIIGEKNIDVPQHDPNLKILRLFLNKKARANPDAISVLKHANVIILGPGDLFSSILPNLLVDGITRAIKNSHAVKIYICNSTTKYGETNKFTIRDFIEKIESFVGKHVLDYVLVNSTKPTSQQRITCTKEKTEFVRIPADFIYSGLKKFNLVSDDKKARYDHKKLGSVLSKLITTPRLSQKNRSLESRKLAL